MTILATAAPDLDAEDRRRSAQEKAPAPRRINLEPDWKVAAQLDSLSPLQVAEGRAWWARFAPRPNGWYARYMVETDRYLAKLRRDPVPFPEGTPEYAAYRAELRTELAKWVAGEA